MRFLRFLLQQRENTNSGFALAFVLAIGVVMSLAATTMMIRASNQKQSTQALEENLQADTAVEIANNRVKYLFIKHPSLLLSTPELWEEYITYPESSPQAKKFNKYIRGCQSTNDWNKDKEFILDYAQGADIPLENLSFYLVDFSHLSQNKAQITVSAETANGSRKNLQADIRFEFVYPNGKDYSPGLWVQEEGLGRSIIEGDFWTNDCQVDVGKIRMKKDYKARHVPFDSPKLPDLFEVDFRLPSSHELRLDNSIEAGTIVLPRSDDQPTKLIDDRKIYEYIISEISPNTSIELNSIVDGESVTIILYIKGKVNQAKITHRCGTSTNCPAENLVILGYGSETMCFVTDKLNAFIFAPYSPVGVMRDVGETVPEITGAIWIQKLVMDNSCGQSIKIFQSIKWSKVPANFQVVSPYPRITELSTFKTVDSSIIDSFQFVEPPMEPPLIPQEAQPIFLDDDFAP